MVEEYEEVEEYVEEDSIWGQPSDVDFLEPATSVSEYEEMLEDDISDGIYEDIVEY